MALNECECPMIRLRQLIPKHGHFKMRASVYYFIYSVEWCWIEPTVMSSYISNVTNLTPSHMYGSIITSIFVRLFFFRVSFIRVTIYCVSVLYVCVLVS